MSLKIDTKVDTREFERALIRYKVESRKGWKEVIREQSRLLLVRLLRLTPPKTQAQGRKAVAADIRKVMTDLDGYRFESPGIQKAWDEKDWDALEVIFRRSPEFSRLRFSEGADASEHRSARTRRGRVPKRRKATVLVKKPSKLKRYIRDTQKRVGLTKAGWMAGLKIIQGKIPGWVSKHGSGYGSAKDASSDRRDPHIQVVNATRGIGEIDREDRILTTALQGRSRDMLRSLKKKQEFASRRSGFRR
jgi:hypothetical protein